MMRPAFVLVVALAAAAPLAGARPQTTPFDEILDKATDYVTTYNRTFVGVVAEEVYRQDVKGRTIPNPRGFSTETFGEHRNLKSDMLLVRANGSNRWIQFRDVFEVDGKPVRDREERLAKLFLEPSASTSKQVADIIAASARYNIGGVDRNINVPVLALTILEPLNHAWFAFKGSRKSNGTWDLEYREVDRGVTLIQTNDREPMPAHGHFSVNGADGSVLSSTLVIENPMLRGQIDVTYGMEPAVGMLVPKEMREKYEPKGSPVIDGRAMYSRFRRYQVTVDEKLVPIKN